MKNLKKVAALLMAISMAASCAAGCSSDTASSTAGGNDAASAAETGSAAEGETGGESAEPASFPFDETLEITMMMEEAATQKVLDDSPLLQVIRDELNVELTLQPIPTSDWVTKRAAVLASNTMPDIMRGASMEEMRNYAPTGMLLCIEDYRDYAPEYFALIEGEDRINETNKFRVDGKTYIFQTLEYYRVPIASISAMRMDLLEEAGLEMPTTWDEFYDALLAIKEKHPDMVGFSSRFGTKHLIGQYAYSLGTGGFQGINNSNGMYYEPESDSYVYGPTSEKFTRVVEFLANAYKDGLLDPDYATMTKDVYFEKLSSGQAMSICDNNSFIGRVYNPAISQVDPEANFDIVPPLENEDGTVRQLRYEKDWLGANIISSQTAEPEKVVQFMNWFYTDEGRMLSNFGREGIEYDMVDGMPTIKQEIVDANAGADDVFSAIQSQLGVGLQGLALYVDETTYKQVSDPIFIEQGDEIAAWTEEGTIVFSPSDPAFTSEQSTRVTELLQNINNVFDQEIDKFIIGQKSMDEWPAFVEQLKAQGTEELEQIYNDAYSATK